MEYADGIELTKGYEEGNPRWVLSCATKNGSMIHRFFSDKSDTRWHFTNFCWLPIWYGCGPSIVTAQRSWSMLECLFADLLMGSYRVVARSCSNHDAIPSLHINYVLIISFIGWFHRCRAAPDFHMSSTLSFPSRVNAQSHCSYI